MVAWYPDPEPYASMLGQKNISGPHAARGGPALATVSKPDFKHLIWATNCLLLP